jgi:hypothetical protein
MDKAHKTFRINYTIQRHSSQLKEIYLLPVHSGNRVFGIRQADKRNFFILPVLLEGRCRIWTHRQDHRVTAPEFFMLITQARQLRAAIGSQKSAQESQDDRRPAKIGQTARIALHIVKFKIRSRFPRSDKFCHWLNDSKNRTVAAIVCCC